MILLIFFSSSTCSNLPFQGQFPPYLDPNFVKPLSAAPDMGFWLLFSLFQDGFAWVYPPEDRKSILRHSKDKISASCCRERVKMLRAREFCCNSEMFAAFSDSFSCLSWFHPFPFVCFCLKGRSGSRWCPSRAGGSCRESAAGATEAA